MTDIVSVSAVGYREDLPPGTFVLIDKFVDRTVKRESSFFGTGCVICRLRPSGQPGLMDRLEGGGDRGRDPASARRHLRLHGGPQFSTLAESLWYKSAGFDVISMTNMPEAKLAREAEIPYATVAMVTDFDCWHQDRPRRRRRRDQGGARPITDKGTAGWWRVSPMISPSSIRPVRSARTMRSTTRSLTARDARDRARNKAVARRVLGARP